MTLSDSSEFQHYLALLESENSLKSEMGFQQLRPRTAEFIDNIITSFSETSNPNLRHYLFVLLVESKLPQAQPVIQQVLDSQDQSLLRTYAGLIGWGSYFGEPYTLFG